MSEQAADTPVLDVLAGMTAVSLEKTTLEADELMLVRIAALVAADAPPASYLINLGAASELDIDIDKVRGVFSAIAPIVGTARIATAMGNIAKGLAFAEFAAELDEAQSAA